MGFLKGEIEIEDLKPYLWLAVPQRNLSICDSEAFPADAESFKKLRFNLSERISKDKARYNFEAIE